MAFRRRIRTIARCQSYDCGSPATEVCDKCKRVFCQGCVIGHAKVHAKRLKVCTHG